MKKLFSLFVPLMALLLTLAPQTARAQINEYFNIRIANLSYQQIKIKVVGNPGVDLYYSSDKTNWTKVNTTSSTTINLSSYNTYYFKGNNSGENAKPFYKDANNYVNIYGYTSSGVANVNYYGGNIMSLVYGDDFATNYETIPCDYCFKNLCNGGSYRADISALSLPANVLTEGCYYGMFESTGSSYTIIGYPKLPAQKLAPYCYARMFAKAAFCSVNNTSIILPAEELANHCYEQMFEMNSVPSGGYTRIVEIMATTMRNREGVLYTNPLQEMFKYTGSSQISSASFYSKVGIYFTKWDASSTTDTNAPTYNWWGGYYNNSSSSYYGRLTFYHDKDLPQTKTTSGSTTSKKASYFPQYCTLNSGTDAYGNTIDSVVFNCAANEGYWNEGLTYNTNLRRVVRTDYTMKTVPAAPYNKDGKRFIGWFTSASGAGSLVTESQLKAMTSGTTVYARFASDSEYTLYIEPSDKATITATDGTDNFTAGTVYLRTAVEAARTITLSSSDVTSGYSVYKYTCNGLEIAGSTTTFGTSKDLTLGAIVVGTSSSASKSVTVYQAGTGAGTSSQYDLPSQAVDLGEAGIWAKYNVDDSQEGGFATSETATGGWYAWGMLVLANNTSNGYAGASSMTAGDNLPVTDETDAAYRYCGHSWRIPTRDEFQKLLDNTTQSSISNNGGSNQILTSKSNGNTITLPKNGYKTSTYPNDRQQANTIKYWTSTKGSGNYCYGYCSGMVGNSYVSSPELGTDKTISYGGNTSYVWNYYYYGFGIRPIFDMDSRVLTIHSNGYTYIYNCDLYQQMTITATAAESYSFKEWQDADGNVVSTTNPLVVMVYDNLTYTAVYKEGAGVQHEVVFYDYDGESVLERKNVYEDAAITYTGETPTRAGYEFTGWDRALGTMGGADVSFTAQYVQTFTLTLSGSNMSFTMTADGYDPQTTSGTYRSGTEVTITAKANDGYIFEKWNDDVTTTPRVVTLTANTELTASYRLVSDDQTVNVYQNETNDITKILYNLDFGENNGKDGKTYKAVDMGYGVAWADRNVGATSTSNHGGWYQWGGTTDLTSTVTSSGSGPSSGGKSTSSTAALTSSEDAATVVVGDAWHMPTKTEWETLISNTTVNASSCTFTNKTDNSKSIYLPTGGYYYNGGRDYAGYSFYWANARYSGDVVYMLRNNTNSTYQVHQYDGTSNNGYSVSPKCVMPVRAIYQPTYTTYTLTVNVGSQKYQYICQAGQNITVTANAQNGYVFDKWTEDNNTNATRTFTVTGNMSYTATFVLSTQYYDVTLNKDNNTYGTLTGESSNKRVLSDIEENTGITISDNQITINGTTVTATPTASDAQYTYSFEGWFNDATNPATQLTGNSNIVTADMTITAHFTRTLNTYTVTIVSSNAEYGTVDVASVASVPYGTVITTSTNTINVNGTTVTATPTASTVQYTYAFDSWTNGTATVNDDLTVTANFTRTTNQYTLTVNAGANGSVTGGGTYYYGASAELTATPDDGYHFVSWSDGGAQTHSVTVTDITAAETYTATFAADATYYTLTIAAGEHGTVNTGVNGEKEEGTKVTVTATADRFFHFKEWQNTSDNSFVSDDASYEVTMDGDKSLTAVFEIDDPIVLNDNEGNDYYTDFDNLAGETVNLRLNRTFNAGIWSTVCLPFDLELESPLYGKFWRFDGASGDWQGLDLHFGKTGAIQANVPYLFKSATSETLEFSGVTLKKTASVTTGDRSYGDVAFVSVVRPTWLTNQDGDNHTVLGLQNNKVYYPNMSNGKGNLLRAFRAYFIVGGAPSGVQPRVRIIAEGQTATELEFAGSTENGTGVRKYVENGMLIIERNGVRYDATGARLGE